MIRSYSQKKPAKKKTIRKGKTMRMRDFCSAAQGRNGKVENVCEWEMRKRETRKFFSAVQWNIYDLDGFVGREKYYVCVEEFSLSVSFLCIVAFCKTFMSLFYDGSFSLLSLLILLLPQKTFFFLAKNQKQNFFQSFNFNMKNHFTNFFYIIITSTYTERLS